MDEMQAFRPVAEAEVILAFLRGEIDSQRFGSEARRALLEAGGLQLVLRPNLDSAAENTAREQALARYRGWRSNEVFEDFPQDVRWFYGVFPPEHLERIQFIDYSYWNELSGGSRLPKDVRRTISAGGLPEWLNDLGTDWCFEFAERLKQTRVVEDVIVMGTTDLSELVLLEGHARLTALFVGGLERELVVRGYLGVSDDILKWDCF
jgi:hypothetical protein